MVKKFQSIVSIIIACIITTVCFVGCKKQNVADEEKPYEMTDISLVENNVSEYCIVVSENATSYEMIASSELQLFFLEATDYELPIITDKGLKFNKNDKYLSVGRTKLLEESGVEVDYSKLDFDGFVIKTIGRTVIMCGGGEYGTQFAVYKFLEVNLGWKCYAEDEIVIPKASNLKLVSFDHTIIPDFIERKITYYNLVVDQLYARRLKLSSEGNFHVNGGHSYLLWLPLEQYYDVHKDWYSTDPHPQLCLSNMEMRAELIKQIEKKLIENKEARYIWIGQEDVWAWCKCEHCQPEIDIYGCGGQNVRFLNYISDEIMAWVEENMPERKDQIRFITYAYMDSLQAPVKVENGKKVPIDETVIARDNICFMVAALHDDYTYSITDARNKTLAVTIEEWSVVSNSVYMYMYSLNALNFLLPYYNFNAVEENYRAMAENPSVRFMFDQGQQRSDTSCFRELHAYVQSNLMWDTSLSTKDLVEEFITQYYGPCANEIMEFYESERNWMNYCFSGDEFKSKLATSVYATVDKVEFWPKLMVDSWNNLLNKALKTIEPLKETDNASYEKYYWRVKKQQISIIYMLLNFHSSYYTKEQLVSMVEEFDFLVKKFNFTYFSEGMTMNDYVESLRSKFL